MIDIHPIFPSILSTNFFDLESRLETFASNGINYIHLDVMDGHFVDNISFGPSAIKALKSRFDFRIDSHLMVDNPEKMIPKYIEAGTDWVSFHIETDKDHRALIEMIHQQGCKAGIVLNPDADIARVFPLLPELDYVLLMSVFPGYGGQKFIEATIDRVNMLKEEISAKGYDCLIQVDGGVNADNAPKLRAAGADLFVIGTFLYNSNDIENTINIVLNKINGAKT